MNFLGWPVTEYYANIPAQVWDEEQGRGATRNIKSHVTMEMQNGPRVY
jgi:hypothetical protein